jgi:hypothetical protein
VLYTVSRINIHQTTALEDIITPNVAFTGIPIYYHKDVKLAFGDYVEAYEGTDNTSCPRSAACIAVYPVNNAVGSWQDFTIETRSRVRPSSVIKLVTNVCNLSYELYSKKRRTSRIGVNSSASRRKAKDYDDKVQPMHPA